MISETKQHFFEGELFSTEWITYQGTKRWLRVVFAKPQEHFNCELLGMMTVKAFSEKKDMDTGRVYMRSYETPDGSTLSRDYITGQCTTRRKDGREVVHDTALLQKMMELTGGVQSF